MECFSQRSGGWFEVRIEVNYRGLRASALPIWIMSTMVNKGEVEFQVRTLSIRTVRRHSTIGPVRKTVRCYYYQKDPTRFTIFLSR